MLKSRGGGEWKHCRLFVCSLKGRKDGWKELKYTSACSYFVHISLLSLGYIIMEDIWRALTFCSLNTAKSTYVFASFLQFTGKVFETRLFVWFPVWFCKLEVLNSLPQIVQCSKMLISFGSKLPEIRSAIHDYYQFLQNHMVLFQAEFSIWSLFWQFHPKKVHFEIYWKTALESTEGMHING